MSVDVRVPEQGLVTIAPEELLLSKVVVFVLSRPLRVRQVTQVLSVLSMLQFNTGNWDGSQQDDWQSNVVGDLGPQLGDTLRVVNFLRAFSDELFTSLLVVSEGIFQDVLGHVAVAMGVESNEIASSQVSKHFFFLLWFLGRTVRR